MTKAAQAKSWTLHEWADGSRRSYPQPAGIFPLSVHASGRYLVDAGGNPFQIRGDTAWGIFAQLTIEEATIFLDDRAAKGVNTLLVSMVEEFYSDDPPNNVHGEAPFTSGLTPDTSSGYWDHVDEIVQLAKDRGIAFLALPVYLGWSNDGSWSRASGVNQAARIAYGEFIGSRYQPFGNFIFLGDGDRVLDNQTEIDVTNDIMVGVKNAWPGVVCGLHENSDSDYTDWLDDFEWMEILPIYSYTAGNAPALAATYYAHSPPMPVFWMEGAYENEVNGAVKRTRVQAWQALLAGGIAGTVFGNNPIWGFNDPESVHYYDTNLGPRPEWQDELDSEGSLGMAARHALLDSLEWWKLEPDSSGTVVTSSLGTGDDRIGCAIASDDSFALVYVPSTASPTVDMTEFSGPNVLIRRMDPVSGAFTTLGTFANTGTQSLTHPGNNSVGASDWVWLAESV